MKSILSLAALLPFASSATPSDRAWEMVKKMNLTEKITMLHGHPNGDYVGNIAGNERLGIPSINMQDGPQGFRVTPPTGVVGSTTAWPSGLSVAGSWDTDLLYRWAAAMGQEFRGKGANVQLGPGDYCRDKYVRFN
jgi:beta-glucosidase